MKTRLRYTVRIVWKLQPESQLTAGTQPRRGAVAVAPLSTVLALGAGLALRAVDAEKLFEVNGDSLIYGGMAKNLLLHGRYALTLASG